VLGEVVASVAARLAADVASVLGVVVIDASSLDVIEALHGAEIRDDMLGHVEVALREALASAGCPPSVLARGEIGRSLFAVIVVRDGACAAGCEAELRSLAAAMTRALALQGRRLVYPYQKRAPDLPVGYTMVIRNPKLAALTQVRQALDAAEADAALNRGIQRRARRRRFLSVLLGGGLRSVYEPIVCAKTLTVYGYEALVRGPERSEHAGAVELFAAAREHDLLYELDCQCRAAALEGAIDFPAGSKLFINVRPSAIHDPRFHPDALRRTLDRCRLTPSDVVFEISEQESIENYDVFREARDRYGQLGFQFALDDTGAGYASLEAVMKLAPEFVKVDRAFISGIDEDRGRQAMVGGFQQVARSIGARIIGEGLDRLEELQKLAELGIEFGQGWLFGQATPLRASGR
jgi:EAL domain-containing protein (putative c-di-GMP-specific phosphodiesterase class I)